MSVKSIELVGGDESRSSRIEREHELPEYVRTERHLRITANGPSVLLRSGPYDFSV